MSEWYVFRACLLEKEKEELQKHIVKKYGTVLVRTEKAEDDFQKRKHEVKK
ncbi:hypothetical protein ACFL96_19595 [Thermoproteota archaeon]